MTEETMTLAECFEEILEGYEAEVQWEWYDYQAIFEGQDTAALRDILLHHESLEWRWVAATALGSLLATEAVADLWAVRAEVQPDTDVLLHEACTWSLTWLDPLCNFTFFWEALAEYVAKKGIEPILPRQLELF